MYISIIYAVKVAMFSLGVYNSRVFGLLRSLYRYLLAKFDCAAKPLTVMHRYDALHLDSDDALRSIGNIQVTLWQPLYFTMIRIQSYKQKTVQDNGILSVLYVLSVFISTKVAE